MRRAFLILTAGSALAGCSTVSFAPPAVPITYAGVPADIMTCQRGRAPGVIPVTRDVHGAWNVIDAHVAAYTCSRDAAANGRQAFEVPAFISTTGAAAAIALGATPATTIGVLGTTGNSVFNAGKAYYDPQAKADMYNSALSALLCVRNVSVGVPATKVEQAKTTKGLVNLLLENAHQSLGEVTFLPEERYFMMVTTAVFQVRDILGSRLKGAGKPLASTVADEIKKAADDAKAKQDKADQAAASGGQNEGNTNTEKALFSVTANTNLNQALLEQTRREDLVHLQLDALQPKLDECVATAKL